MEYLTNFYEIFSSNFFDPKKRVFAGYLFSGFLIAIIWSVYTKKLSILNAIKFVFDKKVYISKSAITDYSLYIINLFIMIIFSPILLSQLTIATLIFELLHTQEALTPIDNVLIVSLIIPISFTFSYFVLDDFSKFLVHFFMHRIPFLWSFHKVHHSAEVLTPITVFRTHPFEGIVFVIRNAISQGAIIGIFYFVTNGNLSLVTVLGANLFSFTFHLLGSNLRHSHVSITYWKWLEYFLISPAQHQIHHSIDKNHHDKNFGVTFAFWDLFFGSLVFSKSNQDLTFGLLKNEKLTKYNVISIYFYPIKESFIIFKKSTQQLFEKLIYFLQFIFLKIKKDI